MKKIILFDLDNTFYKYQDSHNAAMNSVFDNQVLFDDYKTFVDEYSKARIQAKNVLKGSTSKNNRNIYFKFMLENIKFPELSYSLELEALYWENFIDKTIIDNLIVNTLKEKKEKNILYHLYTNLETNTQLMKLKKWNLDIFDRIVTSEEAGYEKPHENFITFVENDLDKLYKKEFKFYAVGDSIENDLKPWKVKYNAKTYLINSKSNSRYVDKKLSLEKAIEDIFTI